MKGKMKTDYEGLKRDEFVEVERIRDSWVTGKKQYRYKIDSRRSIEMTEDVIYVE